MNEDPLPPEPRCPCCGRTVRHCISGAPSIPHIIATCAEVWEVTPRAVLSESREAPVVAARHLAIWLARECITPAPSHSEIAAAFRRKDRATVSHALAAMAALPDDSRQKRLFLAIQRGYKATPVPITQNI